MLLCGSSLFLTIEIEYLKTDKYAIDNENIVFMSKYKP